MLRIPRLRIAHFALALLSLLSTPLSHAQSSYQPSPENIQARREFQDMKFGMFIHWGIYSVLGEEGWAVHDRKLTVQQYDRLPMFFNPEKFDTRTWVALAKAAGMKYITITSRHHDGFAMFDSKVSDWNIVARSPYKKDPLKLLADECHRQGVKLFVYYSQLDWHNPDYFPRRPDDYDNGRPNHGDWNAYLDTYMNGQLNELLSNYGPIAGVWLDGMGDKPEDDWHLDKTYALIHRLQPAALIISNHHGAPFPGEDVQTFEKDLPGQNTTGYNTSYVSNELPLETAATINDSWGFNIADSHYKSVDDLKRLLVRAAGMNANLLLNIGPYPNGEIDPQFSSRLKAIGEWLSTYGDSIYGTRGGPIAPGAWGVTTQKEGKIYVHVLDWPAPLLALPPMVQEVVGATTFLDSTPVTFTQTSEGLLLKLPRPKLNETDRVVVLTLKSEVRAPAVTE